MDILPLAEHFLGGSKALDRSARQALLRHTWPGNVRELKNTMLRAALLAIGAVVAESDLGLPASVPVLPRWDTELDKRSIEACLQRCGGVVSRAAAELGLSRQALYRRMDRLGMARTV